MDGTIGRPAAFERGKAMIQQYTRLEQEHALLWVKHRTNFPAVVNIPPEMQKKLDLQRQRFIEDLDAILGDAERVFLSKQNQQTSQSGSAA